MSHSELHVGRENLLQPILSALKAGAQTVFISGSAGVGVSTLLSQLAGIAQPAVELQIRSGNRLSYDPSRVFVNMVSRLATALGSEAPEYDPIAARSYLSRLLVSLERKSHHGTFVTFIVDGLHQVPNRDDGVRQEIIDQLPLGEPGCRFVISGPPTVIPTRLHTEPVPLVQTIPGFSFDETKSQFVGVDIDDDLLKEIWKSCGCNPTVLASVRRLILSGIDPTQVLPALSESPPRFFELEWSRSSMDEDDQAILAVLANDDTSPTLTDLAAVVGLDSNDLSEKLRKLTFVQSINGAPSFVSPIFRVFAQKKLARQRNKALDLLIAHHSKQPDAPSAVAELPRQLTDLARHDELLKYFSVARFPNAVAMLGSASVAYRHAVSGIAAAKSVRRHDELTRFCIHAATVTNLHAFQPTSSEVKALLALGRHNEALAVAESASMAEDRMKLLAAVGRDMREGGITADERVPTLVTKLYEQISPAILGTFSMQLAEDLLFVKPELGIALVDLIAQRQPDQTRSSWLYVGMSTEAARYSEKGVLSDEVCDSLQQRISDPEARIIAVCAASTYEKYTGRQVLNEAARLVRSQDRYRFVSDWVAGNCQHRDVFDVIDKCFDWITSDTSYVPDLRVLRRLSQALYKNASSAQSYKLISKLDDLTNIAQRRGPSQEFARIQTHVAGIEWHHARIESAARLDRLLIAISDLQDPATRASCLVYVWRELGIIDPERVLDVNSSTHTIVDTELELSIEATMNATAEPHRALRSVVLALATRELGRALDIVSRFNSPDRRDLGHLDVVYSLLRDDSPCLNAISQTLTRIVDADVRGGARIWVLLELLQKQKLPPSDGPELILLMSQTADLAPRLRCRALALALALGAPEKYDLGSEAVVSLEQALHEAWGRLETDYRQTETAFEIASRLAKAYPTLALEYFEEALKSRRRITFDDGTRQETYVLCTSLAIRAFATLAARKREKPQQLEDLTALINEVPSRGERLRLWVDLGLRFAAAKRLDDCQTLYITRAKPIVDEVRIVDGRAAAEEAAIAVAPLLFQCYPDAAVDQFAALPQPRRDEALFAAAQFVLQKVSTDDSCSVPMGQRYPISYEDSLSLIRIAENLESDARSYSVSLAVACAVSAKKSPFTREQKSRLRTRLLELAKRYPVSGYIRHGGYNVITRAQAYRIDEATEAEWAALLSDASNLKNESDAAYVVTVVASCMKGNARDDAFDEAQKLIDALSSTRDRLVRLVDLADAMLVVDKQRAKAVIERAKVEWAGAGAGLDLPSRRLVDLAHRVDGNFAATVAAALDDDPARTHIRSDARARVDVLKLAENLLDLKIEPGREGQHGAAAWMALGDLNSGRRGPLAGDEIWQMIENASVLPLRSSYPLFSLAISSAGLRFGGSEDSADLLRQLFTGTVAAARVAGELASRKGPHQRAVANIAPVEGLVVSSGKRFDAVEWLKAWCEEHVRGSLIICDPYFGLDELDAIKLVGTACPDVQLTVVTSRKHLNTIKTPHDEIFRDHWRLHISSQSPPATEIIALGVGEAGGSPIHDRWWLSDGVGIKLGTSFNGLGSRDSVISWMTTEEYLEISKLVERYTARRLEAVANQRLQRSSFLL